jgi:hypothetical protein
MADEPLCVLFLPESLLADDMMILFSKKSAKNLKLFLSKDFLVFLSLGKVIVLLNIHGKTFAQITSFIDFPIE